MFINSCAYFKLKTLDSFDYNKNDIYTLLSNEYKKFAKFELYEMHDEIDANYFAYKGLMAVKEKQIFFYGSSYNQHLMSIPAENIQKK